MKIVVRISALYLLFLGTKPKLYYKRGFSNEFYTSVGCSNLDSHDFDYPSGLEYNCSLSHALYTVEGLELKPITNTICV